MAFRQGFDSVSRRHALALAAGVSSSALGLGGPPDGACHAAGPVDPTVASLRLGVIGCGGRGTMAAIGLLEAAPGSRVVAMADRSAASIEASAGLLRRRTPGACDASQRFVGGSDWEGVFDAGPDIVILATPADERPAQILRAVAQGVHLFCERPAAATLDAVEDLRSVAAEADRNGVAIVTALSLRHDRAIQAARERLTRPSGPWGGLPPRNLTVSYPVAMRAAAGVARWTVEQLVIDAIDVALWAAGDPRVDRVRVAGAGHALEPGPRVDLETASGPVVRLVPVRRAAGRMADDVSAGGIFAEGSDPGRLARVHRELIAAATRGSRTPLSASVGEREGRSGAFERLLEATRLAILVAAATERIG